jgi:hypothetical protein
MLVDPPPSAAVVQPIKKVGHNNALSGVSSPAIAPTTSPPAHFTPSTEVRSNKRPRDVAGVDDQTGEIEEKKAPSSSSSSSPSVSSLTKTPLSSSSSTSVVDEDVQMTNESNSATVVISAPAPTMASSLGVPPSAAKSFVSVNARRDTLATRASIDCRTDDVLLVSVRVQANHPDGVPTIARQQYLATEEMKRQCTIKFLGSKTGLDIKCPTVPRYLLQSGAAYTTAINNLTPSQRVWHEELMAQATKDFHVVRGEHGSDDALADACEWVWAHLIKATGLGAVQTASTSSALPLVTTRRSRYWTRANKHSIYFVSGSRVRRMNIAERERKEGRRWGAQQLSPRLSS